MSAHPPLRLGIAGCGPARRTYGPILPLLPTLQVTALMDSDQTLTRAWARTLGGPARYSDYSQLLAEAPIDAVLLTLPPGTHAAQMAVRAGKHVLCEMPLARSLEECDALLREAAESRVVLMPVLFKRFDRVFLHATRLLAEGQIGRLNQVRCHWSSPANGCEARDAPKSWKGFFANRAGQTLDLCRWWLGDVETVSGDVDTAGMTRETSEIANLILNHPQGVSVHHIARVSHQEPSERYLLHGAEGTLEIACEPGRGRAAWESLRLLLHRPGGAPEDMTPPEMPATDAEIRARWNGKRALEHFAACVRDGAEPCVTGLDARHVLETLTAACLSTVEQTKITLPLGSQK